ncbi:hypothetical protein B617_gp25 [Nonlabens phage P12024S]|uniref:Uncharacterized protein n=1 Tax=Nonlabens phage P12024S TaxID=1168478 RepID=I6R124_9CAUD|nr:hypothetical protein B617_gp25 [Nonlabens phage P12024S]AFM54686.1 hypothetical protein P12024S_25 [Nonlabens phage P12024S]
MEIGEKFTFYSNGIKRKALFLSQIDNRIKAVICDNRETEGINIEIYESQIILDNQISLF